jgi:leucyl/phenylalanyl-tRNA--protein transferase
MPIYRLSDELWFPGPEEFEDNLVAVGGDLSVSRLLLAYSKGIFPWYEEPGEPRWYCPEERCVFHVPTFKPSKSTRLLYNKGVYRFTFDHAFHEVILACAGNGREDETWILPEMIEAYLELHALGFAHSVEVWRDGQMVGGLYGVNLGGIFCGESMFSTESNTSKLALWHLVQRCREWGMEWIDGQVENSHLVSLGGKLISRDAYLNHLEKALQQETHRGKW